MVALHDAVDLLLLALFGILVSLLFRPLLFYSFLLHSGKRFAPVDGVGVCEIVRLVWGG